MPYDHGWLNKGTKYTMQTRESALNNWLKRILGDTPFTLIPLAGDASFRRYFRLQTQEQTRVIMDAPPNKETLVPFIHIESLLASLGILTPTVYAVNHAEGFAILEDLGDRLLLGALNPDNANARYTLAINTLHQLQQAPLTDKTIPLFDKAFMRGEIALFREWFLEAWLGIRLSMEDERVLNTAFEWLVEQIAQQPCVLIHRDYHSRNLLLVGDGVVEQLGVIDFQDAMYGPVTYDLVSLLRDCYIQWPEAQVHAWVALFHQQLPTDTRGSLMTFQRAFDLCGLQRHLKVLGVFCRLHLRDNKPAYLRDLPLTLHYVMTCISHHDALQPFYRFMQDHVQQRCIEEGIA